jgi:hypothetical protein
MYTRLLAAFRKNYPILSAWPPAIEEGDRHGVQDDTASFDVTTLVVEEGSFKRDP